MSIYIIFKVCWLSSGRDILPFYFKKPLLTENLGVTTIPDTNPKFGIYPLLILGKSLTCRLV